MDNERIREICMALPHVAETLNWGHHLVYWVGDRAIGGRMFAMTDIDGSGSGVLSFHCGEERFHELLEIDGIRPTPYMTKSWVTLERWGALRPVEFEEELRRAYDLIFRKLSKRTCDVLALPEKDRTRLIRERTGLLAAQAAAKKAESAAPSKRSSKTGATAEPSRKKR